MINREGLDSQDAEALPTALHDCTDEGGWKSDATMTGYVAFDLGAPHWVSTMLVWNHGQLDGERGVYEVRIQTSLDGESWDALADGPSTFERAEACPVAVQTFDLGDPVWAQWIRINVVSSYTEGGTTNTGLGEVAFLGHACDP